MIVTKSVFPPRRGSLARRLLWVTLPLGVLLVILLGGPRVSPHFEIGESALPAAGPAGLRDWIAERESEQAAYLRPRNESSIRLYGDRDGRAEVAFVYIHGFSASPREIHPLMEQLADAHAAHLFIPRLAGHGFAVDRLGKEASLQSWIDDTVEALEIGRRLGRRVVLVGYSNGANLALLAGARVEADLRPDALVLIAPNFLPADPAARYLAWPWARWWIPRFFGRERMREAANPAHGDFWSLRYETEALFAMKAGILAVRGLELERLGMPTQVIYAEHDRVVDVEEIVRQSARIGPTPAEMQRLGPDDFEDPGGHILAGDVFSPSGTPRLRGLITAFVESALAGEASAD